MKKKKYKVWQKEIYKHIIGIGNFCVNKHIYPSESVTFYMELLLDENHNFDIIDFERPIKIGFKNEEYCLGETFIEKINDDGITFKILIYVISEEKQKLIKQTLLWSDILK